MRRGQKLTIAVSLVLALVIFAGAWQPADAAYITKTTYQLGNDGIYIPNGFSENNVSVKRSSLTGGAPVKFKRTPITLKFVNDAGSTVDTPFILTYVYFNLWPWERRAYDKGDLSIYYKDLTTNTWKKCNSILIANINDKHQGRIACLAVQYTTYGIGVPR